MALIFEIYRDGIRQTEFAPVGAIAMGPESVPIPGDVRFIDGQLIVDRIDDNAAGVSLLWDLGKIGSYMLDTTRLQVRENPYNLNVELARSRLMRIVQKQEDWNLFDFPRAEKFQQQFKEAQNLLAEALGILHEPEKASVLADQSLQISVPLAEELAEFHCELLLTRRRQANGFARHIFGCKVDSTVQNSRYKDLLVEHFDYAIVPMGWKQLQPEEDIFNTAPLDDWVEMLSRKRIPIVAGPLINLTDTEIPDWLFIWEHDYDTLRELAYEYVQKVVHRYRKAVSVWNVVAGLHANSNFHLSFEQIIELTRLLVSQVKTIIPNAKTLVTVTQPYGEYHAHGVTGVPPMLYAEMVAQSGVNFEAFGVEMEMGVPTNGGLTRDLFQVSSMLDKFSSIGRPVFLTGVGVPDRNVPDSGDRSDGKLNPSQAGQWKRPWDPALQAEWMEQVYKIALSKPYVESVAWGNLADINQSIPGGGLMDDMFKPKPVFQKVMEMRDAFKRAMK